MRFERDHCVLVVIDVQEKLLPVIDGAADVERNIERLVRGAHLLGVPAILTEQYVRGLGPTTPAIRTAFAETSGYSPIEKACFSAHGCSEFVEKLATAGRSQVIVAGVETHVCVAQTVHDLLAAGYTVTVAADAVSSRTARNREIALQRLVQEGALLTSTEMILFELLVESGTDEFRAISRLVR